jgi:hypothetical protein
MNSAPTLRDLAPIFASRLAAILAALAALIAARFLNTRAAAPSPPFARASTAPPSASPPISPHAAPCAPRPPPQPPRPPRTTVPLPSRKPGSSPAAQRGRELRLATRAPPRRPQFAALRRGPRAPAPSRPHPPRPHPRPVPPPRAPLPTQRHPATAHRHPLALPQPTPRLKIHLTPNTPKARPNRST